MINTVKALRPLAIAAALTAAASAIPTAPAQAQNQATGARHLLLLCQARAEQPELDLAQCSAYLRGFLDRVLQDQVAGRSPEFCPPRARISAQTAATALTRLAFREPAALDEPAPVFLSLALQRAFPCDMPDFNQPIVSDIQPANPVSVDQTMINPAPLEAAKPAPMMAPTMAPTTAPVMASPAAPASPMQQTAGLPPQAELAPRQDFADDPLDMVRQPTAMQAIPPRPAIGMPGTVGPVTDRPGNRLPGADRVIGTPDGMQVALPPSREGVVTSPINQPSPPT
ncbi:MAG: Rap1a/Tai family immunity protein, partial [Pseudomonadota bacterium]